MGCFPALKENKAFKMAYYHGKTCVSPLLVSYVRKNRTGVTRVGITVSKKVGKAVLRNRSRRVIRAAYAELMGEVLPGYDIVFVARGRTPHVKTPAVSAVMRKQLRELRVLSGNDRGSSV